ncbi:MAG: RNA methyltransferase, partial [Proteiniphilum sp.]|nr:RNA methyltransferase [Proteiniphilum sp.]
MGLSKNRIKYIRSLKEKKFRSEHNTFVAEGPKLVFDLLATCRCQFIAALPEILTVHPEIKAEEIVEASESELKKATFLKTAPQVIAVFYRPDYEIEKIDLSEKLSLVLDGVQDPGNVGAIIRIADWFGIEYIICSEDTADIYNPKTVQATMGAI